MPDETKPVIAYLDDDPVWLEIFNVKYGDMFDLRCFRSGEEFLSYLEAASDVVEAKPNGLVIDWWLREDDEVTTARETIESALQMFPGTPVVVLTHEDSEELIRETHDLGAVYLDKEHVYERSLLCRALGLEFDDTKVQSPVVFDNQDHYALLATQHHLNKEGQRELQKRTYDLISIIKDIVNPEFSFNALCTSLLKEILGREPQSGSALFVNAGSFGGILLTRDGGGFREENITLHDLGHARRILERVERCEAGATMCLNNLEKDVDFQDIRRVNSKHAKHALIFPVRRATLYDEAENGPQALIGFFLLFAHRKSFDSQRLSDAVFSDLPLTPMLQAAQAMPFRYFDDAPIQSRLLRWFHINTSSWWGELHRIMLETLRFGIFLVAVAFVVWPLIAFVIALIGVFSGSDMPDPIVGEMPKTTLGEMPKTILGIVEHLVMIFTLLVMSLGLLVLLEPRNAGGLPAWIRRFTHIAALKSTVLTLVVILLAIFFLTEFIEISREEMKRQRAAQDPVEFSEDESGNADVGQILRASPGSPLPATDQSPDASDPVHASGELEDVEAQAPVRSTPSAPSTTPRPPDPSRGSQDSENGHEASGQEVHGRSDAHESRRFVSTGQYLLFSAMSVALVIIAVGLFIRWNLREQ